MKKLLTAFALLLVLSGCGEETYEDPNDIKSSAIFRECRAHPFASEGADECMIAKFRVMPSDEKKRECYIYANYKEGGGYLPRGIYYLYKNECVEYIVSINISNFNGR